MCVTKSITKQHMQCPIHCSRHRCLSNPQKKNSADMNLIQRIHSISKNEHAFFSKFKDCSGELGTLPEHHQITMNPKVKHIIHSPSKVSFTLKKRKKLKQEFQWMTQLGIIIPVPEQTNDTLRVCFDLRNLNKSIKQRILSLTDSNWHISGNSRSTILHEAGYLKCLLAN